jgi:2-isopropylmalate synthase
MAIKTRNDAFKGMTTGINTKELYKTSRLVSKLTGMVVQANKAIVGSNAFSHESGIHQDGVLKERTTYEIMKPEDVGFEESKLVLGKHSGRHAFVERLKKLGFDLDKEKVDIAFDKFKKLADKKKEIFDEDLETIVDEEIAKIPEKFRLMHFYIASGDQVKPTASIKLKFDNKVLEATANGDGPVDACYKAVDKITGMTGKLLDYQIRSVTSGKDALGEVAVKISSKGQIVSGRGASTDVIEASIKAYVNAANKLVSKKI